MKCLLRGLRVAASAFAASLLASLLSIGTTPVAAATCASLGSLVLPDTTITAAQPIPTATPTAPYTAPDGEVFTDLPAFCRVAATLTPTSDSDIRIEVWMPSSGWNGRYLGTGNGGIGGVIVYGSLAFFLGLNCAVANTDLGASPAATDPLGGLVLTGHPEKQIDYATRSTNLMTVRAEQIIKAFYGEPPTRSYFYGCSTGGGQGVHEALQFPGDYDGIFARAPHMNRTHNGAATIWDYGAFNRSPVSITAAQMSAVNSAIVRQCAGKDGGLSSDNFLTAPRDCHWNPGALQCTGTSADTSSCLTAPQGAAMRKFYQGPINPRTGERIYPGRPLGSEVNQFGPVSIEAAPRPNTDAPYWVFGTDFDWRTYDFDRDVDTVDEAMAARLNANTADLEEFKSHGGKLILWHGFADPQIPPLNTVAYYERLIAGQTPGKWHGKGERKEGLRRTQEFSRLFLAPGVGHCNGGAGPDAFDGLTPLVQWVEQDVAPHQIIASKVVGGVTTFTRPLCPYPALPRYTGVGDTTKARSFACVADSDDDDNQPPAPKYLNDGDNYPIVPITTTDDLDKH
jgi:feruloyl esterase